MNTTNVQYSRKDYLLNKCTHREYYSQFVNDLIKHRVIEMFGLDKLLKSKDKHLNDLSMSKWDWLSGFVWHRTQNEEVCTKRPSSMSDIFPIDYDLLIKAGDGYSNSTGVCIYKEAAKQIKEESKHENN